MPVTMPSLHRSCFFPGMLMTDGCHGATGLALGITVIDSQLILTGPQMRSWPRGAFQLARRGGLRATAELSKRTIVADPHV